MTEVVGNQTELVRTAPEVMAGVAGVPCADDPFASIKRAKELLASRPETPHTNAELHRRTEMIANLGLAEARPLERIDLEQVEAEGLPKVPYLRAPWIAERDVVLISMKPGDGKSTFAYTLAYALASGTPFLDACGTDPIAVGIFDGEAGGVEAARLALSIGPAIPGFHLFSVPGLALTKPGDAASIEREIIARNLKVLIFDSVSSTFGLSDENDAAQVARAFAPIGTWKERHGCTTVLLHHLNKGSADNAARSPMDRVRGSSAFSALASVVLYGERAPGGKFLDISCAGKARGRSSNFSARVELIEDKGRLSLHCLGTPERAESVIESAAKLVRAFLAASEDLRAKRKAIVDGLSERIDEDTVDRVLKHLEHLKVAQNVTRGYWQLIKTGSE